MEQVEKQETPATGILVAMTEAIAVTKANAKQAADELKARIADKRLDPLKVYERLAFFAEVYEQFQTDSSKAMLAATVKEQGAVTGKVISGGGLFATRAVGTTYDYSTDPVHRDLLAAMDTAKEMKKRREEFLKGLVATIEETYKGEKVAVAPPVKHSKDGFVFTMNKGHEPPPLQPVLDRAPGTDEHEGN